MSLHLVIGCFVEAGISSKRKQEKPGKVMKVSLGKQKAGRYLKDLLCEDSEQTK